MKFRQTIISVGGGRKIVHDFEAPDKGRAMGIADRFVAEMLFLKLDHVSLEVLHDDVPSKEDAAYMPPMDRELLGRLAQVYSYPLGVTLYYETRTHRFVATGLEEYPGIPLDVYLFYYERKHGGVL